MSPLLDSITASLLLTIRDVIPIALIILVFQALVIRRPVPNPRRLVIGFAYVLAGLCLFVEGLEHALFPVGRLMARQLAEVAAVDAQASSAWTSYYWVYVFAFAVGLGTTIAEPALIAVAMQARDASGGSISVWGLRVAVALGVAIGVALGAWRIVTGLPIAYFIVAGYIVVAVQTAFAPRQIVPLAYDSGGVTTSTVTVPLVAALGLGLAENVPGRSAVIDGFGLIAFASLFPMMTVMGYAQLARRRRNSPASTRGA